MPRRLNLIDQRLAAIPGVDGYCIADDGRVFSKMKRRGNSEGGGALWVIDDHPQRELAQQVHKGGYRSVQLRHEGKRIHAWVHSLVLLAFVGECPEGMECAHWDGDPANNKVENLRWATRKGNSDDRFRHGTAAIRERHGMAILDQQKADQIRRRCKNGEAQKSLASEFGVTPSAVWRVVRGLSWVSK